jgi:hypothetical protein
MLNGPYNLIGLIIFVFDLVAIFSVLAGRSSVGHKALWTLLILMLPVIGMILYYVTGKNRQDAVTA